IPKGTNCGANAYEIARLRKEKSKGSHNWIVVTAIADIWVCHTWIVVAAVSVSWRGSHIWIVVAAMAGVWYRIYIFASLWAYVRLFGSNCKNAVVLNQAFVAIKCSILSPTVMGISSMYNVFTFQDGYMMVGAIDANMCKKLPSDTINFVIESDARALEHALMCLNRIAEAFAASSNQLDELCIRGFVKQVATLISTTSFGGGQASLSSSTYTIRLNARMTIFSGLILLLVLLPFWVDSFACSASFACPKSTEFSVDDYAVIIAHPAPFQKFSESFLCLIGMSRNCTLDGDTYPTFLRDDRTEEARLWIVGHVVSLLLVVPAYSESELEASVERLFNEGGSADHEDSAASGGREAKTRIATGVRIVAEENVVAETFKRPHKKRKAVTDASGSSHPPKRLRGDHRASSEVAIGVKSSSALRELLASSMLNVKVGIAAVTTLPMVTSSVSATLEHESDVPVDSITGLNIRTIGASERFVISLDFSHNSSTNASGTKGDSIIRSVVVPSVMTEAVVTSYAVNIPSVREMGIKVTSPVHASLFYDSDSTETVKANTAGPSYSAKQDHSMGSRELNSKTLQKQAGLLKAKDDEVENLKAQLLLKEAEAAKASQLQSFVSAKDLELKDLNVAIEEFQDVQMNIVNDKVAQLDADLLEMALHLEEKFYPHLLTTIFGRRWLLTHGLKLVVVKCLNSQEYLSALGAAISRAIEKGMQNGLSASIDHGKASRNLADDASVEDIMNLLRLEGPLADAPGMSDLQPHVDQLMLPVYRFEDQVVLGETSLLFALSVTHSHVEMIMENVVAKRSDFIGCLNSFG
nr:E3 ubiquitin-protein ligase UPL3 isoform X2 [Tanacetum cinerariifolium]